VDADPGVPGRVLSRDVGCPIRTAVVDDDVVPMGISLGQHALDTFAKILFPVVDGSYDADEGFQA